MIIALSGWEGDCERWATMIAWASLWGGLAIVVAWMICRAIPKTPPGIRCWVWRAALLKLVIGLVWIAPVAIPVLRAVEGGRSANDGGGEALLVGDEVASEPSAVHHTNVPFESRASWGETVIAAWGLGVAGLAGMYLSKWNSTRRLRRGCAAVRAVAVRNAHADASRSLGVARLPALLQCDGISGPVVLGTLRPVVVVPTGFDRFEPRAMLAMLAHELAHVVRQDTRWGILALMARTLFWFHPLVWFAQRELSVCQESACDEAAMRAAQARPSDYGRMLVELVAGRAGRQPVVGLGVISTYSSLHRRISAMSYLNAWSGRRRVLVGTVIALVAVCGIVPWTLTAKGAKDSRAGSGDPRPATAPTAHVDQAAPADGKTLKVPGVLLTQSVVIRASHDGTIQKVSCKPGDSVKKGQGLAQFDDSTARSELQQVEATLERDKLVLQREIQAKNAGVGTEQLENSKANVAFDEAQIQLKQHELSAMFIRAPIDGVVSELPAHEGEFVTKGTTLVSVVSVKNPRASFWVPISAYSDLRTGQPVEFKTRAFERTFAGKIRFISPQVDAQSAMVTVEADIEDPDGSLRPGLPGEVTVSPK